MWPRYPGAGEIPFGCGINPWGMLALYAPNLQFAWAMEASDGGPSATSIVARSRPEYRISPGSSITWFSGLLISASGLLLIGITSLQWAELQPPGSTLGPLSYVQALTLRITEGIYTCIFGVVLSAGGFILSKRDAPEEDAGRWLLPQRWRSRLPYAAGPLILIASFVSAPPAPAPCAHYAASVVGRLLGARQIVSVRAEVVLGPAWSAVVNFGPHPTDGGDGRDDSWSWMYGGVQGGPCAVRRAL